MNWWQRDPIKWEDVQADDSDSAQLADWKRRKRENMKRADKWYERNQKENE
jgi:hypothetical protein